MCTSGESFLFRSTSRDKRYFRNCQSLGKGKLGRHSLRQKVTLQVDGLHCVASRYPSLCIYICSCLYWSMERHSTRDANDLTEQFLNSDSTLSKHVTGMSYAVCCIPLSFLLISYICSYLCLSMERHSL